MKINKRNIYIALFAILWLGVAMVSLIHAVSFFALGNSSWLAIALALIFEIGQSVVLFSILTSSTGKSKFMPWVLMCVLTMVQILGNVYSSYKYILTNSLEDLKYFKEPIFIWTTIPDDQATVIVTFIVGGILPLVALAMSAMVSNYLNYQSEESITKLKELNHAADNKLDIVKNNIQDDESPNVLNNHKNSATNNLKDIEHEFASVPDNIDENASSLGEPSHFINI